MSCALIRITAFASILILLSGCGGSSGSSGNSGNGGGNGGGGNPTTVTVNFAGATPNAVATQIGSGSFTAATPAGTIALSLPSGTSKFAVAFVCTTPASGGPQQSTDEYVQEATTAEGTSFTWACGSTSTSTGTTGSLAVNVDASAIPNVSQLWIEAQNGLNYEGTEASMPTDNSSFLAPVGSDSVEILAYYFSPVGVTPFAQTLVGAKFFTGQTVPGSLDGGNLVALGAADRTSLQPITYKNVPAGASSPSTSVLYYPTGAEPGGVDNSIYIMSINATSQYPVIPAGAALGTSVYLLEASASVAQNNGNTEVASFLTSNSSGPVSITFPGPWVFSAPTPAALPTLGTGYTGFAGMSQVSQSGTLTWLPTVAGVDSFSVAASQNYQNGATSLTFPNLSGIPGFLASPASGTTVDWNASVTEGNFSSGQALIPNANLEIVTNAGAFTVP